MRRVGHNSEQELLYDGYKWQKQDYEYDVEDGVSKSDSLRDVKMFTQKSLEEINILEELRSKKEGKNDESN